MKHLIANSIVIGCEIFAILVLALFLIILSPGILIVYIYNWAYKESGAEDTYKEIEL